MISCSSERAQRVPINSIDCLEMPHHKKNEENHSLSSMGSHSLSIAHLHNPTTQLSGILVKDIHLDHSLSSTTQNGNSFYQLYKDSSLQQKKDRNFSLHENKEDPPLSASHYSSLNQKKNPLPTLNKTKKGSSSTPVLHHQRNKEVNHKLYSLENLAENCLHAVQTKDQTWQFPKDSHIEKSVKRSDLVDLENCLDLAMHSIEQAKSGDTITSMSSIEKDYSTILAKVNSTFPNISSSTAHPNTTTLHSNFTTTSTTSTNSDNFQHENLSRLLLQQKWCDVVLGEIESQLMVSFIEQGSLVRKLRRQYSNVFCNMLNLHLDSQIQLQQTRMIAYHTNEKLNSFQTHQEHKMEELERKKQTEIETIKEEMKNEILELSRKVNELKEQNSKMTETMRTLNGIFKQMREDSDTVRMANLHDAYTKLLKKCEVYEEQIIQFRPFQEQAIEQNKTIERLQLRNETLEKEINEKTIVVEKLIQYEGFRLTEKEMKKCEMDDKESIETQEETTMHNRNQEFQNVENEWKIKSHISMETTLRSVFCAKCNENMDSAVNIESNPATKETKAKKKKMLQCTIYRILLPNLAGSRPVRPHHWTLGCMRAILHAKHIDDTIAFQLGRRRIRLPEFVYAWFAPNIIQLKSMEFEERETMMTSADENRWALYYGVKLLAKEMTEAMLFYVFLDEKFGEDEIVFAQYCLRVVERMSTKKLLWGPINNLFSYEEFCVIYNQLNTTNEISDIVMVDIPTAIKALNKIMVKATSEERETVSKKLIEKSTTMVHSDSNLHVMHQQKNNMIDIHVWLRVILQEYREEQAHRKAAIKLMFQTASTAEIPSFLCNEENKKAFMDMDQFTSMVQSLNADAAVSDIALLYRRSFNCGNGEVTCKSFMLAAEEIQFFGSSLKLPHFISNKSTSENPTRSAKIGSIVELHYILLKPMLSSYRQMFSPGVKFMLQNAEENVIAALNEGHLSHSIDGHIALCAYRRLIQVIWHALVNIKEVRENEKADSVDEVDRELTHSRAILVGRHHDRNKEFLNKIKKRMAILRIQAAFRARLNRDQGVPLNFRHLMDKSYGNGKNGLRRRRAYRPISWLILTITSLFYEKAENDRYNQQKGDSLLSFSTFLYYFYLQKYGSRWEAEKQLHDLFVNVRLHTKENGFVETFSLLCGMGSGHDDHYYSTQEAFSMMFHILKVTLRFHKMSLIDETHRAIREKCIPCSSLPFYQSSKKENNFQIWVSYETSWNTIRVLFKGRSETTIQRMEDKIKILNSTDDMPPHKDMVNAQRFMVYLLYEWKLTIVQELNQLRIDCCTNDTFDIVGDSISLKNLRNIVSKFKKPNEYDLTKMYHYVVDPSSSKTPSTTKNWIDRVIEVCFISACESIFPHTATEDIEWSRCVSDQFDLLQRDWEPYRDYIFHLLDKLQHIVYQKNYGIDMSHGIDAIESQTLTNVLDNSTFSNKDASIGHSFENIKNANESPNDFALKKKLSWDIQTLENGINQIELRLNDMQTFQQDVTSDKIEEFWTTIRNLLLDCSRIKVLAGFKDGHLDDVCENVV